MTHGNTGWTKKGGGPLAEPAPSSEPQRSARPGQERFRASRRRSAIPSDPTTSDNTLAIPAGSISGTPEGPLTVNSSERPYIPRRLELGPPVLFSHR